MINSDVFFRNLLMHVEKLFTFVNDRDGEVSLMPIDAPRQDFASALEAFEYALAGEECLSRKIDQVVETALSEHDHATHTFMQWFVNEQVEEEAIVRDIVHDLKLVIDSKDGLFLIDRDLAGRKPGEERNPGGAA